MCGCYFITLILSELEEYFDVQSVEDLQPRYNAAPSQILPVILNSRPNEVTLAQWGLSPPWLKKIKNSGSLINVRSETLREKSTFRSDLQSRRCLILADGFYEWKKTVPGAKIPYCITRNRQEPFAFAGIWQTKIDAEGKSFPTFAIITTSANVLVAPIHDRMPVILNPADRETWFSGTTESNDLLQMLRPAAAETLRTYEVSRMVNKASVDVPQLLEPVRL